MKRRLIIGTVLGGLVLVVAAVVWLCRDGAETIDRFETVSRPPKIHPDYADTVIPPNICPMNFVVDEPGEKYCVKISSKQGRAVEVFSRTPAVVIPVKPWRRLLGQNGGEALTVVVYVKGGEGVWRRFSPMVNRIAVEPIDGYLVYREMPVYNLIWKDMGLYQRNLQNYDQSAVLHNRNFNRGCCNCHSFLNNSSAVMAINVRAAPRGKPLGGLVIVENGAVSKVVKTATKFNKVPAIYLAWHPSGRAIAFSTNKVNQVFYNYGHHRHAVDSSSDMGLYLIEENMVTTDVKIARPEVLETSPAWSPDGEYLYFCRTPRMKIERYKEFLYDLVRIRYDIETNTWGEVETVLSSKQTGLSIAQPKISPDGRWLLFCMCDYGNFPAFRESSDLYLMDLKTRKYGPLDVNSVQSESWHSWSSNSRWIVFSSKRPVGLLARPHFSYVNADGKTHKAFILPQKDPTFYETYVRVVNRPELAKEPVCVGQRDILRALHSPAKQQQAKLDPKLLRPEGMTGATYRSPPKP